jgi:hypothetical protein
MGLWTKLSYIPRPLVADTILPVTEGADFQLNSSSFQEKKSS